MEEKRFLRVYMDLNNKCNLKCKMCYFSLDLKNEPSVVMSLPLFEKIAAQVFPKAIQLNLSCAAEPLLVPNFTDYLAVMKRYNIPTTLMVTNAFLLNEKTIKALIDANMTYVDISIDGATKATYEKIRKGGDFDRVVSNVRMLQRIKKEMGAKNPMLYLDYTLMKSTIDDFPDFLRLAKDLGADSVRANHLIAFKRLDITDESLVNCREKTNEVFARSRKIIAKLGLNAVIPQDFDLKRQPGRKPVFNKPGCRTPFDSIFIVSDGRATPCTWFSFRKYCAGDLRKETFAEIWNGRLYTDLRKSFDAGKMTDYCINCPVYGSEDLENYVFQERERDDVINICSGSV